MRRVLERIWICLSTLRAPRALVVYSVSLTWLDTKRRNDAIRHEEHMHPEPKRVNVYLYTSGGILLFAVQFNGISEIQKEHFTHYQRRTQGFDQVPPLSLTCSTRFTTRSNRLTISSDTNPGPSL
jgi:hypothetical protein